MSRIRSKWAAEYHRLYKTRAWKDRRLAQLQAEPLCAFCLAIGRVQSATVADHVEPHRGDDKRFYEGELQSLCKPCHDGSKARIEAGGYDGAADLDGYPIDRNHPNGKA